MKTNLTLIGMPGAGKSTIGIILAKNLSLGFIDSDVLIQINQQKSLQDILDENDYLHLRQVEENEICKLNVTGHVIATGGSAAYSAKAMQHLQKISTLIFLHVEYEEIKRRIKNFETRGIAKAEHQTFRDLFNERQELYRKYADIVIMCDKLDQDEVAMEITRIYQKNNQQR